MTELEKLFDVFDKASVEKRQDEWELMNIGLYATSGVVRGHEFNSRHMLCDVNCPSVLFLCRDEEVPVTDCFPVLDIEDNIWVPSPRKGPPGRKRKPVRPRGGNA